MTAVVPDVKTVLPHRYPILLVDRVRSVEPGRVIALKAVTGNEPWYAELADDADPAYPAALLVESWCQAAGVLAADSVDPGLVMLLGGLTGVRFGRPVLPGDVVEHHVVLERELAGSVVVSGHALAGGDSVLTVERAVMAHRSHAEFGR